MKVLLIDGERAGETLELPEGMSSFVSPVQRGWKTLESGTDTPFSPNLDTEVYFIHKVYLFGYTLHVGESHLRSDYHLLDVKAAHYLLSDTAKEIAR